MVEHKAYFVAFDLPHSDACYGRAYPTATSEAWVDWVDGHVHAFAFFDRVPVSVLYDNDKCLVARILPRQCRAESRLDRAWPEARTGPCSSWSSGSP
jgi:transposase